MNMSKWLQYNLCNCSDIYLEKLRRVKKNCMNTECLMEIELGTS